MRVARKRLARKRLHAAAPQAPDSLDDRKPA